jgi:hypothetical protein
MAQVSPLRSLACIRIENTVEQNVLSSHSDATRFFVTFVDNHDNKGRIRYVPPNASEARVLGARVLPRLAFETWALTVVIPSLRFATVPHAQRFAAIWTADTFPASC